MLCLEFKTNLNCRGAKILQGAEAEEVKRHAFVHAMLCCDTLCEMLCFNFETHVDCRGAGIPQGAEAEEAKGHASAHASAAG